jgi:hypothetical protein
MISFLSLITLLLRLSLAIQGQLGVYVDDSSNQGKLQCKTIEGSHDSLQADPSWYEGNVSLTRKLENEERVEVEGESFLDFSTEFSLHLISESLQAVSRSVFGTKAIRGSLLPLYDFFHSWKIHLS